MYDDSKPIPKKYLTDEWLNHPTLFIQELFWRLPAEQRWEYVNRFEETVLKMIHDKYGGELIELTKDFNSKYDACFLYEGEHVYEELKSSRGHKIFIEAGRANRDQAGLSATESHVYIILTFDRSYDVDILDSPRKVKVRIIATHRLIDLYFKKLDLYGPSIRTSQDGSPGADGMLLDLSKEKEFINDNGWLGDLHGYVQDGMHFIDLSKGFVTLFRNPEYNQFAFDREIRIALKHSDRQQKANKE